MLKSEKLTLNTFSLYPSCDAQNVIAGKFASFWGVMFVSVYIGHRLYSNMLVNTIEIRTPKGINNNAM